MLLVPKVLSNHAYGSSTLNRSRFLSGVTMGTALLLILLAGVELVIELPSVAKLFQLPQEIIIHEPPKKKKFEILFTEQSDFIYQIEIKKVVEPPKKKPEPIPEPPKPKPKPQPVAKPQAAPKAAPVADAPVGEPTEGPAGASGDQVLAELLAYVNKYKVYPRAAQKRGIQGTNYIVVTIHPNGRVEAANLGKGTGNSILDNSSKKLATKLVSIRLSAPNKPLKVNVPIQYSFRT